LRQNCQILSTSAKFSAVRSLLPACNFSAVMGSTCSSYCFGAMAPQKIGRGKPQCFNKFFLTAVNWNCVASKPSSYCLGDVALPHPKKIWRLKIYVKTWKFPSTAELHTIVLSRPFMDCHEICIKISREIKADNVCFEIFIYDKYTKRGGLYLMGTAVDIEWQSHGG